MHNHFGNLVRAADPQSRPRGTSVTISGSGMDWHDMESYFRPGGIGRYSFVGDNEIVFNKPEMAAQLAEQYTIAGRNNDALVIPAGLAFARAVSKRPDLELYQSDKRHPSLLGTYLAASTAYAAIHGKSPVGNAYTAGIDAGTARFLQTVAWETVREYFGD